MHLLSAALPSSRVTSQVGRASVHSESESYATRLVMALLPTTPAAGVGLHPLFANSSPARPFSDILAAGDGERSGNGLFPPLLPPFAWASNSATVAVRFILFLKSPGSLVCRLSLSLLLVPLALKSEIAASRMRETLLSEIVGNTRAAKDPFLDFNFSGNFGYQS